MIPIAPDAWPYLAIIFPLSIFFFLVCQHGLGYFFLAAAASLAFFFRDPERIPNMESGAALSPADGKVLKVEAMEQHDFIGEPTIRISIFLSLLNVHINRSPVTGKVLLQEFRAGKMLPAFDDRAPKENESNTLGIETIDGVRVAVKQITGLLARKIVCRVNPGDNLLQGQRFGLIKFGSCTELFVPATAEILVKEGDIVKGGMTKLAKLQKGSGSST